MPGGFKAGGRIVMPGSNYWLECGFRAQLQRLLPPKEDHEKSHEVTKPLTTKELSTPVSSGLLSQLSASKREAQYHFDANALNVIEKNLTRKGGFSTFLRGFGTEVYDPRRLLIAKFIEL